VLDVRLDADGLLVVPTQRSAVPEIVAALVGAGVRIYSVVDVGASLEEAYVALHERRVELAR
ncbi:MAG TPA: hypothetical protein VHF25_10590, partial [Nitriliruptorales bacterium]|nr:hypothetical protein [Nitriliruptorales bacterium]